MTRPRWIVIFGISLVALITAPKLANAYFSVPAGAFTPAEATDAPYIHRDVFAGAAIYNGDPSNYRNVTTGQGMVPGNTTYTAHIYGYGRGLTQSCNLYAINLATFATYFGSNSTTASGNFNYAVTLSLAGAPGTFAVNLICSIPPASGGSVTYLYGVT